MSAQASQGAFSFHHHPRAFADNRFVYAVLSRRAGGVSIGINLSPAKRCNFQCVYCQVERTGPLPDSAVDENTVIEELQAMLRDGASGRLAEAARRDGAPAEYCRVADVAFSGDGEPTAFPGWASLASRAGEAIDRLLPGLPMTLITNASLLHLPEVRAGLDALAARGGSVWAKLDAGREETFRAVNGCRVPFGRVLENIGEEARRRPLEIQSLFFRNADLHPGAEEIGEWCARLAEIRSSGGALSRIQVTTVSRRPPRPEILPLPVAALEAIAARARRAVPGVKVEVFPGGGERR